MSESQFAYGSFTLDELRSLAASPQVGTMQAMPQSFRALADRVGEVADLLSHAQADLPNWWKGPAAKQAAASLGRAAAEAREFHDSAMGAATAVSRCAQVVAEQQNQMMNVPDAQEPGVSAVVQRPTTPFDALEAARQDAAYQAAHEQAVQVVNGIAAQYVETRAALSTISTAGGENFTRPPLSGLSAANAPEPLTSEQSYMNMNVVASEGHSQSQLHGRTADNAKLEELAKESRLDPVREGQYFHPRAKTGAVLTTESVHTLHSLKTDDEHTNSITEPLSDLESTAAPRQKITPFTTTDSDINRRAAPDDQAAGRESPTPYDTHERLSQIYDTEEKVSKGRSGKSLPSDPVKAATRSRLTGQPSANSLEPESLEIFKDRNTPEQPSFEVPHPSHPGASGTEGANGGMIPPYSGVGPVRHTNEERNPRPAYLKERKSTWLPDTVAVPADGVITPDWFTLP